MKLSLPRFNWRLLHNSTHLMPAHLKFTTLHPENLVDNFVSLSICEFQVTFFGHTYTLICHKWMYVLCIKMTFNQTIQTLLRSCLSTRERASVDYKNEKMRANKNGKCFECLNVYLCIYICIFACFIWKIITTWYLQKFNHLSNFLFIFF